MVACSCAPSNMHGKACIPAPSPHAPRWYMPSSCYIPPCPLPPCTMLVHATYPPALSPHAPRWYMLHTPLPSPPMHHAGTCYIPPCALPPCTTLVHATYPPALSPAGICLPHATYPPALSPHTPCWDMPSSCYIPPAWNVKVASPPPVQQS